MREIESLQKKIWKCDDRDIVPLTILMESEEEIFLPILTGDETTIPT